MGTKDGLIRCNRALALSLVETKNEPGRRQRTPGSEDDDVEEQFQRDLQAAIEASKETSSYPSDAGRNDTSSASTKIPAEVQGATTTRPAFLKDQAQMEKERLERLKRQQRDEQGSVTANPVSPPTKRQRVSPPPPQIEARGERIAQGANVNSTKKNGKLRADDTSGTSSALSWDGELRQIANRLVDPDKDTRPTFRLSEIIGPVRLCTSTSETS